MNPRKKNPKHLPQKKAKIIRLNPKTNVVHEQVVQRAISEVYLNSLKEIDDLITERDSDIS